MATVIYQHASTALSPLRVLHTVTSLLSGGLVKVTR